MSSESEHDWFRSQIATYLSQGLSDPDERRRFEEHAHACEACGGEYERFQQMEGNMSELFSVAMPDGGFEQRIVDRLRFHVGTHQRKVHPFVRKAAVAAGAAIVVGWIGFLGKESVTTGRLPEFAVNLPSVGHLFEGNHGAQPVMDAAPSIARGASPATQPGKWDVSYADSSTLRKSSLEPDGDGVRDFNGSSSSAAAAFAGNGRVTGDAALVKNGSGTFTVSNGPPASPQDQSRATRENYDRNIVRQYTSAAEEDGPPIAVSGGSFDMNGFNKTISDLSTSSYAQGQAPTKTGAKTLKLSGVSAQMSGDITANQGAITVNAGTATNVVKTGGGSLQVGGIRNTTGFSGNSNFTVGAGTVLQNSSSSDALALHSPAQKSYQDLAKVNGAVKLDAEKDAAKSFKPNEYAQASALSGNTATWTYAQGSNGPWAATWPDTAGKSQNSSAPGVSSLTPYGANGFTGTTTINSGTMGNLQTGVPRDVAEKLARQNQPASAAPSAAPLLGDIKAKNGEDLKVVQLQFANAQDVDRLINDQLRQGEAAIPTSQPTAARNTTNSTAVASSVRHVIRSGAMEFEVDSFDSTFVTIGKITTEEGGFIEAANSDKLPNGKVRGTITVRVPPDSLDTLVMKLRALGDLKNQKLGSTDIGKEYTDLESELRAARAMEERLIDMIKKAQGKVADLLEAEKELGNWRTKIERIQGELNYYNNLTSMATLTISAYEKDIRTPASANETEEINAGVETEDVETARSAAIKAIDDVKGRIVESSLQKLEAGQFAAKIIAEVAPADAGPLVDRLKQLGRVARLDIQRKQTTDAKAQAVGQPPTHVEQAPTRLVISMYNLANVAPRLTTNLNLAGDDVESIYRAILKRVADANGRVISSNLNRQDATQVVGAMQFEVKAADADAVLNDIRGGANVLRYTVTENPDTANVTTAKQAFVVQVIPLAQVQPRLTTNLNLAGSDVEATYRAILKRVTDAGGRIVSSNLNRADATQAIGSIQFELKSDQADPVRNDIVKGVQVLQMTVNENPDTANVTTAKQVFVVQIIPTSQVAPRETRTLAVETSEVEAAMQKLASAVTSAGGRTLQSNLTQDANGRMMAQLAVEVPLDKADGLVDAAKGQGKVRTSESSKNTQVPEGPLARARLNLTIGTGETIVPAEDGVWNRFRAGLSTSMNGLLWSFELIVIGLCLIGPWALLLWGGWKFLRRKKQAA